MDKIVPVGVSARHLHISQTDLEQLFGVGYELTELKPLSQPGQYAAQETVTVIGPKGQFDKVRILGPVRPFTQLELSRTDCFTIGIQAPVRESGDIADTPGFTMRGPVGQVVLAEGAIVAARHIHFHPSDAAQWDIHDKQRLTVQINGIRGLILQNVTARVSESFQLDMHIDTDEANAAGIVMGQTAKIIE